jgi:hypothetical protein
LYIFNENTEQQTIFYYCKLDPKLENINLKCIEDHIRIKVPPSHKTNLLEFLDKVVEEKDIQIK